MGKDNDLFWQLVETEHRKARAYCFRLTGNTDDGDDLYQDSVIRAFRGFGGLKDTAKFRPWFYRIIANGYRARFRSPWWRRFVPIIGSGENIERGDDPSGRYDARRCLMYALAALSPEDRVLTTLSDLEGWKIAELADTFGKTEGLIKMRLMRARRKMRERLAGMTHKNRNGEQKERDVTHAMLRSSRDTE